VYILNISKIYTNKCANGINLHKFAKTYTVKYNCKTNVIGRSELNDLNSVHVHMWKVQRLESIGLNSVHVYMSGIKMF
jgi:hypothetical protein